MDIKPIAYFRSPVNGKFGLPRQSGLAECLQGEIVLEEEFRQEEALRGLEGFDYLWLIWGFHLNRDDAAQGKLTVRPPRLGGNQRIGVFASRSPYRPNPLGLSSVKITRIIHGEGIIRVLGADLADNTPIYDIKPYVEYADSHPGVRSGFTDDHEWKELDVRIECGRQHLSGEDIRALTALLAQDPRPRYHHDPTRIYHLDFCGKDIKFTVAEDTVTVIEIS